jgi:hypothetical protein
MGVFRTTASVVERGLGKTLGCFGRWVVSRALAGFGQSDGSMQRHRLLRKATKELVACGWFIRSRSKRLGSEGDFGPRSTWEKPGDV